MTDAMRLAGRVTVLTRNTHGYAYFRIPAVAVAGGWLHLFAEGRRDGLGDSGQIDLVVASSADGGRHWSAPRLVWRDEGRVFGNPVPIVDPARRRIVLLCASNRANDHESGILAGTAQAGRMAHVLFGDFAAESWSAPVDITADALPAGTSWYASGPGGGVLLPDGRMVAPANRVEAGRTIAEGGSAYALLSDDGGERWRASAPAVAAGGNESQIADLGDGRLLLSARFHGEGAAKHRCAVSRDRGETWTPLPPPEAKQALRCQAALHALAGDGLLRTAPSYLAEGAARPVFRRAGLTLWRSDDAGASWHDAGVIDPGLTSYSDMIALPDGALGLVWECGKTRPVDRLDFARLQIG